MEEKKRELEGRIQSAYISLPSLHLPKLEVGLFHFTFPRLSYLTLLTLSSLHTSSPTGMFYNSYTPNTTLLVYLIAL